jgi:hypothetical protein
MITMTMGIPAMSDINELLASPELAYARDRIGSWQKSLTDRAYIEPANSATVPALVIALQAIDLLLAERQTYADLQQEIEIGRRAEADATTYVDLEARLNPSLVNDLRLMVTGEDFSQDGEPDVTDLATRTDAQRAWLAADEPAVDEDEDTLELGKED